MAQALPKETASEQPIFVSVEETSRLTNLGRTNIFALIREGKLKTVKYGRRRLVVRSSIDELIERLAEA